MTHPLDPLMVREADLPPEEWVRFVTIPGYVQAWTRDLGGLDGRRILDFGCGRGLSAAGFALRLKAAHVHGVDINDNHSACAPFLRQHFGLAGLPDRLSFETVTPGSTGSSDRFDICFSWSTFEHVGNRHFPDVLAGLHDAIVPGGLFFVQIGPLYFSPEGGHLWALGWHKWEHLTYQISDIDDMIAFHPGLVEAERQALWSMFRTLNRITAEDLVARITFAGFTLLREHRTETDLTPPEALSRAYAQGPLRTKQIVALFRRD